MGEQRPGKEGDSLLVHRSSLIFSVAAHRVARGFGHIDGDGRELDDGRQSDTTVESQDHCAVHALSTGAVVVYVLPDLVHVLFSEHYVVRGGVVHFPLSPPVVVASSAVSCYQRSTPFLHR